MVVTTIESVAALAAKNERYFRRRPETAKKRLKIVAMLERIKSRANPRKRF